MNKKSKTLSLITVVKNDVMNIENTIRSIISQKNKKIEYIIINGNSKDGTNKIIKKYQNKIDKIISEKDKGIYDAMNKGVRLANGHYLGFCNSGDLIHPGGIKIIYNKLKNKKLDVLFSTVKRNYLGTSIIKYGYNLKRLNYNFDFATSHSTGFFYKKKFHRKIGYYNTRFKCSADYDFYLRLFKIQKLKIGKTSKNKIIGEIKKGGYSSRVPFINHIIEEARIRIKNKQNFALVGIIFLNAIFKKILKSF